MPIHSTMPTSFRFSKWRNHNQEHPSHLYDIKVAIHLSVCWNFEIKFAIQNKNRSSNRDDESRLHGDKTCMQIGQSTNIYKEVSFKIFHIGALCRVQISLWKFPDFRHVKRLCMQLIGWTNKHSQETRVHNHLNNQWNKAHCA